MNIIKSSGGKRFFSKKNSSNSLKIYSNDIVNFKNQNNAISFIPIKSIDSLKNNLNNSRYISTWKSSLRSFSTTNSLLSNETKRIRIDTQIDPSFIRNVGIIAHIDGGKTTTTERMLFYAGYSNHLGDVDDGDTITDFMAQEVDRGITITSAAITFPWKDNYRINLIDTPGHIDFSLEVERSIRVLDGAVAIFDGAKGVEAQSQTVWKQASKHGVPKIVYVNKMDKEGASLDIVIKSIKKKLNIDSIPIQLPIGEERHFRGIVDLITMEYITFNELDDGRTVIKIPIESVPDFNDYIQLSKEKREEMLDKIATFDEIFAEKFINDEEITTKDIKEALRRITISQLACVLLCGSSLRNKGVQPVLDAIIDYLPNPNEKEVPIARKSNGELIKIENKEDAPFCALAFKVLHDRNKGPMVFFRVYSGQLKPRDKIYNATRDNVEKVNKVVQMHANIPEDTSFVSAGNIGVVIGLKNTSTGDTLLDMKYQKDPFKLKGVEIPAPVFFQTIEAESNKDQEPLEEALQILKMEDPSISTRVDEETAQLLLYGMGELHLDIIRDRLINDFKVACDFGNIHISYREGITDQILYTHLVDRISGTNKLYCEMTVELRPIEIEEVNKLDTSYGNIVEIDWNLTKTGSLYEILKSYEDIIIESVSTGLMRGPYLNYAMNSVKAIIREIKINPSNGIKMNSMAISLCGNQAVYEALKKLKDKNSIILKEPMMKVAITTDKAHLKNVLTDISAKRGTIISVTHDTGDENIECVIPLKEMVGYSTHLRNITNGICSYQMEISSYEEMPENERKKLFVSMGIFEE